MPSIGPMVRRSAHLGGALVVVGSVQFIAAMVWAQLLDPGYSLTGNYISDLGCCGTSTHATIFNDSIRIFGLLVILGGVLLRAAFPPKTSMRIGVASMALAGLMAIGVGSFPEGSTLLSGQIHTVVSAATFFFSGLSLIFLTLAMLRDTRWGGYRSYTFSSGVITWSAFALLGEHQYLGLGPGGMERLVVAPILIWLIVAGIHVLRIPGYRPNAVTYGDSGPAS